MKTKRVVGYIYAFLLFIVAGLIGIVASVSASGSGENESDAPSIVWSDVEIEDTYALYTNLSIPSRTAIVDEETIECVSVITMPNGERTTKTELVLDQAGIYHVSYGINAEGIAYTTEEKFSVANDFCAVTSSSSTVEYGTVDRVSTKSGLVISLALGDTFVLKEPVNVGQLTINDVLLKLFIHSQEVGQYDFRKLNIKLTDAQNPDVFLLFEADNTDQKPLHTFNRVGGNGTSVLGFEAHTGRMHRASWGTVSLCSWVGQDEGAYEISYRFDADSKAAYVDYRSTNPTSQSLIGDLDSASYGADTWEGFESDYAYLSIWCDDYVSTSATLVLTEVLGIDLTQMEGTTANNEIEVDSEYDLRTMPTAVVGMKYPVPSALATNVFTEDKYVAGAQVWYNYTSSKKISVPIVNGAFIPEKAGTYAIEYTAINRFGALTKKVLWINAVETLPVVVTVSEESSQATVGDKIKIRKADVSGGSGERVLTVTVENDEELTVLKKDEFLVDKTGEWKITYCVKDFLGQECIKRYTINVLPCDNPVFIKEANLPYCFVESCEYDLDGYQAYVYSNGVWKGVETEIYVSDQNGSRKLNAGEKFIPYVENNGDDITVKYVAQGVEKIYTLKGIKPFENYSLNLKNYFVTNGVALGDYNDEYGLQISSVMPEGEWTFARELLAENFDLELNASLADEDNGKSKGFVVRLEDFEDSDIAIEIVVEKNGDKALMCVSGVKKILTAGFSKGSESNKFVFAYANGIFSCNDVGIEPTEDCNGNDFNGFPSNLVKLSVRFIGIDEQDIGASYYVYRINGHNILSTVSDKFAARIEILGLFGGIKKIDEVVTLPKAMAKDVLNPTLSFTMSVKGPDGSFVKTIDGKTLSNVDPEKEYTILLSEYGQYTVWYGAKDDFSGITINRSYAINVMDVTPPTVFFQTEPIKEVKLNDVIIVPEVIAEDDLGGNVTIRRMIFTPYGGEFFSLSEDCNSIKATMTGTYKIVILALDETGNISSVEYTVLVKGE